MLECVMTSKNMRNIGTVAEALVQAHFRPAYRALALYRPHDLVLPIGFLAYERTSVDDLQLHILVIDDFYHSNGYGSSALRFIRQLAGILGAQRVRLAAFADDGLIQFYTKNEFQIVREDGPDNHVVMAASALRPAHQTQLSGGVDSALVKLMSHEHTCMQIPSLWCGSNTCTGSRNAVHQVKRINTQYSDMFSNN
jgi:GNAT superfamily N-acetyltransferase